MTDPQPFISQLKSGGVRPLDSFENVHGERFVLYWDEQKESIFMTGDEFDWEPLDMTDCGGIIISEAELDSIERSYDQLERHGFPERELVDPIWDHGS